MQTHASQDSVLEQEGCNAPFFGVPVPTHIGLLAVLAPQSAQKVGPKGFARVQA